MAVRFYNTYSGKKEPFKPLHKGEVRMYNCGPTVYSYAHIGNFRAYIFADLLRRYLEWRGLAVKQVMNITDVGHMTFDEVADSAGEDKIEKAARKEKKSPLEIARFYEKAFFQDIGELNIQNAMVYPRATEHITEMQELVKKLEEKGYAYQSGDSVYYSVEKFRNYGKLSGNTIKQLMAGKRVEVNPEKRNPYDFALWIRNPDHIMQWDSPWGKGYPGWHIECSAMSMKYLGPTLDIHTGGEDNIFPHHECEIAQSEAANGKKFVRYWMHTRHLMVDGRKMSKSLGNFYTLRDLLDKGYSPMAIRLVLLSAHYRTKLNFTDSAVKQAEGNLKTLREFVSRLGAVKGKESPKVKELVKEARKGFKEAMDNDLDISNGLARLFEFVREINKLLSGGKIGPKNAEEALEFIMDLDNVLGLQLGETAGGWRTLEEAKGRVRDLLFERDLFRKGKKWSEADRVREELRKEGIEVEDSKEGVRWKKAQG